MFCLSNKVCALSSEKQNLKNYYKMENVTKFLLGAASIAVGVTLGTWAYNKFLS